MTTDDTRRSDGQGRHRLVSLPVDDLLMALNYQGADLEQQDTAPAWKAARDRVLTAIYEPHAYTCPTACVEQNHPGREHDLAARGGNTDNGLRAAVEALADEFNAHSDRLYDEARTADRDAAIVLRSKSGTYAVNAERLMGLLDPAPAPTDNQWCEDCGWVTPEHAAAHDDHHAAPTDNQRDDGLADRVRALAEEWASEGDDLIRNCYSGRDVNEGEQLKTCATALRAVVDGATTPTQETT